jgi:hypothetical protein
MRIIVYTGGPLSPFVTADGVAGVTEAVSIPFFGALSDRSAGAALLAVTASSWSISLHVIGMAVITCVAVLTIRDTIRRDNTSPRSRGPCRSVG